MSKEANEAKTQKSPKPKPDPDVIANEYHGCKITSHLRTGEHVVSRDDQDTRGFTTLADAIYFARHGRVRPAEEKQDPKSAKKPVKKKAAKPAKKSATVAQN